jgi:hypothetical protein
MINAVLLVFSLIISLPICHLLRLSTPLRMSMQNNEQDRLDKLNLENNWKYGNSLLRLLILLPFYLLAVYLLAVYVSAYSRLIIRLIRLTDAQSGIRGCEYHKKNSI